MLQLKASVLKVEQERKGVYGVEGIETLAGELYDYAKDTVFPKLHIDEDDKLLEIVEEKIG